MEVPANGRQLRFGLFEVDLSTRELYKRGRPVHLQDQPFQLLVMLLERPGEVVTREDLHKALWPADTFVDFDEGLNTAIKKLRYGLGDSPDNPTFIQTVPRRGYRFIAPVKEEELISTRATPQSGSPANPTRDTTDLRAFVTIPGSSGPDTVKPSVAINRRISLVAPPVVVVLVMASLVVMAALMLRRRFEPTKPLMEPLRFLQLTNDGNTKVGPVVIDDSRVYFTEASPGEGINLAEVSVKAGQTITASTSSLKKPHVVDISPDQTELLVISEGSLWILPVAGGSPRRVGTVDADYASWGADEKSIIYARGHDIYLSATDGTLVRKLLTVPGYASHLRFSPDGRTLRFTVLDKAGASTSLWEASADGGGLHALLGGWNKPASECCGRWTPNGRYFVFQSTREGRTDLWAIRETNGSKQRSNGLPVQLTAGPMNFSDPTPGKDSNEVFAVGVMPRGELVRYDLRTHQFVPYLSGLSAEGVAFSRDGQWVTYTSYPEGSLWRCKIDGSERLQLTFPPLRALMPRWSPDGKEIAFMGSPTSGASFGTPAESFGRGSWKIYLISAEGGSPQQLLPGGGNEADPTWSPDGNFIVFGGLPSTDENRTTANIQVVNLNTRQLSKVPGSEGLFSPRWSPDGRYIVGLTNSYPMTARLFDFTTREWRLLSKSQMGFPNWSEDGKYIYLEEDSNRGQHSIVRVTLASHKFLRLVSTSQLERPTVGTIAEWSGVTPDGSPLLARDVSSQEIYSLKLQLP